MAPTKFGLFKSRSRDQPEQPSTENLLQDSTSNEYVPPDSPIPSTSKGPVQFTPADLSILSLDSDDEISSINGGSRRGSQCSTGEPQVDYQPLQLTDVCTSNSTLNNIDQIQSFEDDSTLDIEDDASTSYDANSLKFDETSLAASEDISMYCSMMKKKKGRSKEQQLRDLDMWQASNVEVMQNLLRRSGTLDEQIKWEAIATARGLCTLTDSCTCDDCTRAKYLNGVTDGDGGLGAAPLFSAINVGCQVQ